MCLVSYTLDLHLNIRYTYYSAQVHWYHANLIYVLYEDGCIWHLHLKTLMKNV